MPCKVLPPFPTPPPLPAGVSIPVFPGFTLPSEGLCCKVQVPPFPVPVPAVTIGLAVSAQVVSAYAALIKGVQAYYNAIAIPCPNE